MKTFSKSLILILCFFSSHVICHPHTIDRLTRADHPKSDEYLLINVDNRIRTFLSIYHTEGLEMATQYANTHEIPFTPNQGLRVTVLAHPEISSNPNLMSKHSAIANSIDALTRRLNALGGRVLHRYGLNLSCRLPPESIPLLATQVATLHIPHPYRSMITSEGVGTMKATFFQSLPPFRAQDVHVCVLDGEFINHSVLIGSELPADFTVHNFPLDYQYTGDGHGTACAEIIHDVAPEAHISGIAIENIEDIVMATDWMLKNNVDVVSASIGSYFGPGDGRGLENEMALRLKDQGIVYVNAAGNDARHHWSGSFNDPDEDGWHNFSGDDEILSYSQDESAAKAVAFLRWDDWGTWDADRLQWSGTQDDFDLILFGKNESGEWERLDDASSTNHQPQFNLPYEYIVSPIDNYKELGVAILKKKQSRPTHFHLYIYYHNTPLEYGNASGSLLIPADSPNIVAVGAVDALTKVLHGYSSQGPTMDGRIKPDICAPSRVSTVAYGSLGFFGTSAACPHMAGMIALLKSRTPFTGQEIVDMLYRRALDLGEPGPDNITGYGLVQSKH